MHYCTGRFSRHLNVIFVLYFCLFTISTLSYSGIQESLSKSIPHLYLLEMINSRIMEHCSDHCPQSPLHLPLIKKKAVLPAENVIKKSIVQNQWPVSFVVALLQDNPWCPTGRHMITLPHAQLSSFHSGISPPCV